MARLTVERIENAFLPAREITDPARFAGPAPQIEQSYLALVSEGANIAIVGNRGIGKSSLARQRRSLLLPRQTRDRIYERCLRDREGEGGEERHSHRHRRVRPDLRCRPFAAVSDSVLTFHLSTPRRLQPPCAVALSALATASRSCSWVKGFWSFTTAPTSVALTSSDVASTMGI